MKTKVISVRLESLVSISDKAYKAKSFDGHEDIIPKSQVFGIDYDVQKSDAYWISEWIMEKKSLQYSNKKVAWFNQVTGRIEPNYEIIIEHHIPEHKEPINIKPNASLTR